MSDDDWMRELFDLSTWELSPEGPPSDWVADHGAIVPPGMTAVLRVTMIDGTEFERRFEAGETIDLTVASEGQS